MTRRLAGCETTCVWRITTMSRQVGKLNLFEGTEDVARKTTLTETRAWKRVKRFGKRTGVHKVYSVNIF